MGTYCFDCLCTILILKVIVKIYKEKTSVKSHFNEMWLFLLADASSSAIALNILL